MISKKMKFSAAIVLFVIAASLLSFRSKYARHEPSIPLATQGGLSAQEESDREEGLRIIKSFISAYNSYRLGDVSNLATLYPVMCDSLAVQEKARAETIKAKYSGFKEYVTVESIVEEAVIKEYSADRMSADISITKDTLDGAFLPDAQNEGDFITVDRGGQPFAGGKADMIASSIMEAYRVTAVKQDAQWKICEFNKIN